MNKKYENFVSVGALLLCLILMEFDANAYRKQQRHGSVVYVKQQKNKKNNKEAKEFFQDLEVRLSISIPSNIRRYYNECQHVDGWFERNLIFILLLIDDYQSKSSISGNLAEIGVWQGKSFIPLMLLAKETENALAVDCFEQYECNRDNSGGGPCRFEKFMGNVEKYASRKDALKIIKGDSYGMTSKHYVDAAQNQKKFRIFSIDGCHEAPSTIVDLDNAYKSLVDGGVIIIDDYFHSGWPGVSEGVNTWMYHNRNVLKPFLIVWNKIFFTQPEHAQKYAQCVVQFFKPHDLIKKKFFDVETLIYIR